MFIFSSPLGKKTETTTLVKKVELDGPANKVIKSEMNKKGGGLHEKCDQMKDRSKDRTDRHNKTEGRGSGKLNSSSHKSDSVKSKFKELKDKEFKELFATTDTIPNHVKQSSSGSSSKHESSSHGSKSHRKPSDSNDQGHKSKSDSKKDHGSSSGHSSSSHHGSSHGSHHGSHGSHHGSHSSSHHSSHHHKSSSSSNKDAKRRLSDASADHQLEMAPKNKVPKMTENVSLSIFFFK